MKKTILKIMLGSVILEAALICIFILTGTIAEETTWRAISSVLFIFGYAIPCLFYSRIYDNEKYKYIAIVGAAVASVLALISILKVWELIPAGEILGKFEGTLSTVVYMLVFISWVLSYASTNNLLNLFKEISISLIIILSFWIVIIIWTIFPTGFLGRLFWVLIVLTVGSYICTLILTRIYRKELIKESQKEMMNTDDNPNPMPQTSVSQQPLPNNSVQNQNTSPVQSMESSIPPMNPMANVPANPENIDSSNNSENHIQ